MEREASPLQVEDCDVVDLNVGGTFYSTTRTTLCRFDSMLRSMFSRRYSIQRAADNRVFIDRDGELFKFVLQFLRDGDLEVKYMDMNLVARLRREAAFFCLHELEEKLDDVLTNMQEKEEEEKNLRQDYLIAKIQDCEGKTGKLQLVGERCSRFEWKKNVCKEFTDQTVVAAGNYLSKYGYTLVSYSHVGNRHRLSNYSTHGFILVCFFEDEESMTSYFTASRLSTVSSTSPKE
ncbi:BTB/POZ domain-containing protein kctd6 [Balamuthia mandrillaris]